MPEVFKPLNKSLSHVIFCEMHSVTLYLKERQTTNGMIEKSKWMYSKSVKIKYAVVEIE